MRFVWVAALKDLRILRRDPFGVLSWVGIPLCIGLLIHLMFGGSGGQAQPHGVLLVADQDDSFASHAIVSAFTSGALAKVFTVEKVDAAAGRARLDRGDGSALLIIPAGLLETFITNRPYRLRLVLNAGQRILPRIVEEVLRGMVDSPLNARRVAGGATLAHLMPQYLSPPLIDVETAVIEEKHRTSTADFFFPNMIFLGLLLMANGLSTDIWKERTLGTLRRVAMTPASIAAFLAGRVATVAMAYCAVGLAAVAAARYLAGVTVFQHGGRGRMGGALRHAVLPAVAAAGGLLLRPARRGRARQPAGLSAGHGGRLLLPLRSDARLDGADRAVDAQRAGGNAVQRCAAGVGQPGALGAVLAGLAAAGLLAFWLALRGLRGAFLQ